MVVTSNKEKFKGFKKGYKIILQLFKIQHIFTHYYESSHKTFVTKIRTSIFKDIPST